MNHIFTIKNVFIKELKPIIRIIKTISLIDPLEDGQYVNFPL